METEQFLSNNYVIEFYFS